MRFQTSNRQKAQTTVPRPGRTIHDLCMTGNRQLATLKTVDQEFVKTPSGPVRVTMDVIGGKWKPFIIEALKREALRYGALLRRIPGASRKVLTEQLRELQQERIVSRAVLGKRLQHVEYSLTGYGKTLVPVLVIMAEWGEGHLKRSGQEKIEIRPGPF